MDFDAGWDWFSMDATRYTVRLGYSMYMFILCIRVSNAMNRLGAIPERWSDGSHEARASLVPFNE